MRRTEFTCPQRRNEFGQTASKPSLRTRVPEECVVKVVKEEGNEHHSQDNLRLERTRCNTPKYLRTQEFRRFKHACLGKPRVICRRGTLTPFHQRVAIGRARIDKDKQYIQRIKEFSSMMLSRHKRIVPSLKRSSRRCTCMSILDRFQRIQ